MVAKLSPWSENLIAHLRDLVAAQISVHEIAERLHMTVNAVLGKIFRLNLSTPNGRKKSVLKLNPVPLLEAKPHHCRAPLDQRGPDGLVMFCGGRTVSREVNGKMHKTSWCAYHYKRFHYRAVIGRDR